MNKAGNAIYKLSCTSLFRKRDSHPRNDDIDTQFILTFLRLIIINQCVIKYYLFSLIYVIK